MRCESKIACAKVRTYQIVEVDDSFVVFVEGEERQDPNTACKAITLSQLS
jgi:hypothetical protein